MSEKDKRIMSTFERVVPKLSEADKEKLLAFGEGFAMGTETARAERDKDSA